MTLNEQGCSPVGIRPDVWANAVDAAFIALATTGASRKPVREQAEETCRAIFAALSPQSSIHTSYAVESDFRESDHASRVGDKWLFTRFDEHWICGGCGSLQCAQEKATANTGARIFQRQQIVWDSDHTDWELAPQEAQVNNDHVSSKENGNV